MASTVPGTNLAPISFPGIASGIDYNAIIQKLTALQLSQNTTYNNQVTGLTSANAELIKINSLFLSVQNSLTAISNPQSFNAVSAAVSNTGILTAAGIPNVTATPGTYTITNTKLATASQVLGTTSYGHSEFDLLAGNPADTIVLSSSYAQITPNNGDPSKGPGSVTIDGVKVNYDVNSQSFDFIMNSINTAVQAVDPGFLATVAPGTDTVVFRSSDKPITLGSATDNGNILQVFKLDQAQLVNTGASGLVTAVGGVGGVNQTLVFNSQNAFAAATNANYKTPVTSGTFTINGVIISVDNTKDAVADVLKRINSSAAGVTAAFNQETGQITLTNNGTGPQSIVVGSGGDTSNFLTASGLTTAAGATSTIGAQASVTVQSPGGATATTYSNSNTVTTAINGVSLNLLQASATPFTVTVEQDSTTLVNGINGFISAYNAAINEINVATMAPTVLKQQAGTSQPSHAVGGGVLYGNADVQAIKDALTNIVAGFVPNQSTGYNSFQSIGLQISSSFSVLQANDPSSKGGAVSTQTLGGTDGTLQALDLTKFNAAMAANPAQVQALFTSSTGIVGSLGTYLTGVTGQPTTLTSGLVGTIPSVSMIQGFENSNSDQISSLQQQIQVITDQANAYADSLRRQFNASEQQIAQYQSLQSQLAGFFKNG